MRVKFPSAIRPMPKLLTIGTLARETGCAVETIRYYESEGLLAAPQRTAANYRVYDATHVQRLGLIRQCRALDMTLDEIRALLQLADQADGGCAGIDQLLDEHLLHVQARLQNLRALEQRLRTLRQACTPAAGGDSCGILDALQQLPPAAGASIENTHAHPPGTHARRPRGKT